MVACTSKSPSGTIDQMQKRVDAVEHQVEALYNHEFNDLVNDYQALDTTIARTKDIGEEMLLLQAYLQQFESQRVVIKENIAYSRQQLSDLQEDIDKNLYDDETQAKYILTVFAYHEPVHFCITFITFLHTRNPCGFVLS